MAIEIIDNLNAFDSLRKEWTELLSRCCNDDFFLGHTWLSNYLTHKSSGELIQILLIKKGGRLIGAAPLAITQSGVTTPGGIRLPFPIKRIHFIGDTFAPRCDLIATKDPEYIVDELARYITEVAPHWDMIELRQVSSSSPNYQLLKDGFSHVDIDISIAKDSHCPYLRFDELIIRDGKPFPESYSSKLNRLINKAYRELSKKGDVEIKLYTDNDSRTRLAEHIAAIENESWKKKRGHRLFSRDMADFTSSLIDRTSKEDQMIAIILKFSNSPIAYNLGFIYRNKYFSYSSAYKEEFKNYKPGYILHREMIKTIHTKNLVEYDFLMGDSRYKRSFCNKGRQNYVIRAFNDHPISRLLLGLYKGVRPLYSQFVGYLYPKSKDGSDRI